MLSEKPEYELIVPEIKKGYSTAEIKKSITKEKKGIHRGTKEKRCQN